MSLDAQQLNTLHHLGRLHDNRHINKLAYLIILLDEIEQEFENASTIEVAIRPLEGDPCAFEIECAPPLLDAQGSKKYRTFVPGIVTTEAFIAAVTDLGNERGWTSQPLTHEREYIFRRASA
jgi:hypothetical protein